MPTGALGSRVVAVAGRSSASPSAAGARTSARGASGGGEALCADTNIWYPRYMSTNTSISLDDHFASFLSRVVESGRYRSASEVVRAGLRLLEDEEARMSALRSALVAGEESGEPEAFDFDAFIVAKKS